MKKLKQNVSENSDQIPVDLLIEIFLRVPSNSIFRFRCVSKLWGSILGCPDFTELFLTRCLARQRLLFAFHVDDKLFFFTSPHSPNPNKTSSLVFVDHRHSYFPTNHSPEKIHHLNGLICRREQRSSKSMAVICNPSTRESVTLPEVSMGSFDNVDKRKYFIGYDPIKKQIKVLCMASIHFNPRNYPLDNVYRVMTLGNGKHLWNKTKFCKPHYPLDNVICFNGVLYYCSGNGHSSMLGVTMIVCFDVRSEKFSFIDKDEGMSIRYSCTLVNYKGKLGVVQFKNWTERSLELWILEDARKHKWSNHIYEFSLMWKSIVAETPVHIVGMITGTSDIVFSSYFLSDPFYVFYYNLDRKTLTRTEIQGFKKFQRHRVYTFQDYAENVKPNLLM